jgi:recombination protein RecT
MEKTAIIQRNIVEDVFKKIEEIRKAGYLDLPKDFSVPNAIQAAGLIISQVVDKNNRPALQACSRESIANALLYMITQGLNPIKRQCFFIVYENKLNCQRSYQGSIALAKRYGGVKDITGQTIYEADEFVYEIDAKNGHKKFVKHTQKIDNIDLTKIKGAYAIATLDGDETEMEVMDIKQIRKAWLMSPLVRAKGESMAHKDFTDEMCERTVINRLCKKFIDSSNDAPIIKQDEIEDIEPEVVEEQQDRILLAEMEGSGTKQLNNPVGESKKPEEVKEPEKKGPGRPSAKKEEDLKEKTEAENKQTKKTPF